MSQYERQLFQYFQNLARRNLAQPVLLAGYTDSGGGSGRPPGGFVGQLAQTAVCYDLSEDATLDTVASGESLLDNLNHIRARLGGLESAVGSGSGGGISGIDIYDDTVLQGIATELDFTTGITATVSAGRATILSNASPDKIMVVNQVTKNTTFYARTSAGLQSAITNIANNDEVYLPKGEYDLNPFSTTSKSFSIIGDGSATTVISIDGSDTDQWLFKMSYSSYNIIPTIKGIAFYCSSAYEFSGQTSGGLVYFKSSNNPTMDDVRIYGDAYHSYASLSADVAFYGLWFEGESPYPREEYYVNSRVRNVSIAFYSGGNDLYLNVVGAYVKNYDVENIEIIMDNLDWNKNVTGLIPNVFHIINPYIRIVRDDYDYNGDMIGIYNRLPTGSITELGNEIKNPSIILSNSSYHNADGSTRVIGIYGYYPNINTYTSTDIKILNPYIFTEVTTTNGDKTTLVTPYKLDSPEYNMVIANSTARVKTKRTGFTYPSVPVDLDVIYWVHNELNDYTKYIDIYNSAFVHIDENDDQIANGGDFYDDTYVRLHNVYLGTQLDGIEATLLSFYSIDPLQCYIKEVDTGIFPNGVNPYVWDNYYAEDANYPVLVFPYSASGIGGIAFRMNRPPNTTGTAPGMLIRVYATQFSGWLASGEMNLSLINLSDPAEYYTLSYPYGHGLEPPRPDVGKTIILEADLDYDSGLFLVDNHRWDKTWYLSRASGEGDAYNEAMLGIEGIRIYFNETIERSKYNYLV